MSGRRLRERKRRLQHELRHAVFPILPLRRQEGYETRVYCDPADQGTAFFISTGGLFLTAKHVVSRWSADSYTILALHLGLKAMKRCAVQRLERHPELDLAIGWAELPGPSGWPYPFRLGASRVGNKAAILTYGYANTRFSPRRLLDEPVDLDAKLMVELRPKVHKGKVVEYLAKGPMLDGPCYHVATDPGGGISGAPLIRKRTDCVHGLFSTGIPANGSDEQPAGFATCIAGILDTWRIPLLGDRTLHEYAATNPGEITIV